jgi:hypothetical protein
MPDRNIAGKWRGHYQYRGVPDLGSGFNAFFSETSGQIDGTIVDDFAPGEASITGAFSFPSVHFTKVYLTPIQEYIVDQQAEKTTVYRSSYAEPIEYEGSMSADGKNMSGTWTINGPTGSGAGTWTAYRLDEKEKKKAKESATDLKQPQLEENLL